MKKFMISGPDGTGKSTICHSIKDYYTHKGCEADIVWLRFFHYVSKVINLFGRSIGKSYYVKYQWGRIGYHDYYGLIGYLYIFSTFVDHLIFRFFIKDKIMSRQDKVIIVDRYLLDIMADLIVDTKRRKIVVKLFGGLFVKDTASFKVFILKCDFDTVVERRPDIIDDAKYLEKIDAYDFLAKEFGIPVIDTGITRIDEVTEYVCS